MVQAVVVGAGASGLCAAIQLRRQLGWGAGDVIVFERADGMAGTWQANTYPGCGCDVPSHAYSFSFWLNPDWTKQYSLQPEIREYFEAAAREFDVLGLVRLRHEVVALTWQADRAAWAVHARDLATGADVHVEAAYVFNAVGPLCIPNVPSDIPGLDTFAGRAFHSARWAHDHDLTGRKVAMIGNAASGVQIIPTIAPGVQQLHVFQRTPNWITPRFQYDYSAAAKWVFRNVPLALQTYRYAMYLFYDVQFAAFVKDSWLNKWLRYDCIQYINQTIKDPVLRRKVTPTYNVGCKRILRSDDYLQALARPNVNVITDGIARVTPTSIITKRGEEHEVDTIIYATGFQVSEYLQPVKVTGRDGRDLHRDQWVDGPEAYMGTTVPNFPNFFMLLGPNTGLGHVSVLMMMEPQVDYCIKLIKAAQRQGVAAVEPSQEAHDAYNRKIQRQLERTVWSSNCQSWYKLASGKLLALWPRNVFDWHAQMADVRWRDYNLAPSGTTLRQRVLRRVVLVLVVLALLRLLLLLLPRLRALLS